IENLINYLLFEKLLCTELFNTMGKILQIKVSTFACVTIYLSSKSRIRNL
uniref:Uncharacterized protein n=1 Tax=Microcebus murinus TaxID=30608 RepID=A0A8C6EG39_MICMU